MSDYKPEAGKECEFIIEPRTYWERITPDYVGKSFVVYTSEIGEQTIAISFAVFRPIRTQEEIDREEAVKQMKVFFDKTVCLPNNEFFEQLYDAGYRLVGEKVDAKHLHTLIRLCASYREVEDLLNNYDIYRKVEK